jgi:hypothetical protein
MLCSMEQSHSCYVLRNSPIHVTSYGTVPLIHANESKTDTNNLKTYIMGFVHMSQHHSCSQYHYSFLDVYSMFCLHLALSYDDRNLSKIFILDGFKGITLHIYPQPLTYQSGYLNFSTL